jgi:hypothetical protein
MVALKMRRQSESRIVFEDLIREGWTPHRLPGSGWLMVLDDDHQEPEQARAVWLPEGKFRELKPSMSRRPAQEAKPEVPAVSLVKEEPTEAVNGSVAASEAVLGFLGTAPADGASVAAIRAATGLSQTTTYDTLSQLIEEGHVVKIRHGRYGLVEEVSA